MRVYIRHARAILAANNRGYCVRGMRLFADRYNLDFDDFLKNGVEAEVLLATGDHQAQMVVEEAMKDG